MPFIPEGAPLQDIKQHICLPDNPGPPGGPVGPGSPVDPFGPGGPSFPLGP